MQLGLALQTHLSWLLGTFRWRRSKPVLRGPRSGCSGLWKRREAGEQVDRRCCCNGFTAHNDQPVLDPCCHCPRLRTIGRSAVPRDRCVWGSTGRVGVGAALCYWLESVDASTLGFTAEPRSVPCLLLLGKWVHRFTECGGEVWFPQFQ